MTLFFGASSNELKAGYYFTAVAIELIRRLNFGFCIKYSHINSFTHTHI